MFEIHRIERAIAANVGAIEAVAPQVLALAAPALNAVNAVATLRGVQAIAPIDALLRNLVAKGLKP
jgi:hypothetical protein